MFGETQKEPLTWKEAGSADCCGLGLGQVVFAAVKSGPNVSSKIILPGDLPVLGEIMVKSCEMWTKLYQKVRPGNHIFTFSSVYVHSQMGMSAYAGVFLCVFIIINICLH